MAKRVIILLAILWTAQSAYTQGVDYGLQLKSFLNRDLAEYEIVYSLTPHANKLAVEALAEFNKRNHSQIRADFDVGTYYRVHVAKDGFFVKKDANLESVLENIVTKGDSLAYGTFTNCYWSVGQGLKMTDERKLPELHSRGLTWKDMAEDATQSVLSLGLLVKKGSLQWNDTNFTAEAVKSPYIPRECWGKRCIAGNLLLSNGLPQSVQYEIGMHRFDISLEYTKSIEGAPTLPNILHIHSAYTNGLDDRITIAIFKLCETNFPAGSTSPDGFITAGETNNTIAVTPNGSAAISSLNGKTLNKPIRVEVTDRPASQLSSKRWIVLSALLVTSLVFLMFFMATNQRKPRDQGR
jgi:hypothetical protein